MPARQITPGSGEECETVRGEIENQALCFSRIRQIVKTHHATMGDKIDLFFPRRSSFLRQCIISFDAII